MRARRFNAFVGFALGLFGLVLQASLTIPTYMAPTEALPAGHSLPAALWFFFAYLTILSNSMLVLIYAAELFPVRWLAWFRDPVTRGMMLGVMLLVTGFNHILLAPLWTPEGWWLTADRILHYATTLVYLIWWVGFTQHGALRFGDIPKMLLAPLVYAAWALFRGAIVHEYPYPTLDVTVLGYPAVLLNLVLVALVLAVLFAIVVVLDGVLARRRPPDEIAPPVSTDPVP